MAVCNWCLSVGREKVSKIKDKDLEPSILITALIQNKKELKGHKSCLRAANEKVANARQASQSANLATEFPNGIFSTLEQLRKISYEWEGKDEVYLYHGNRFSLPLPNYVAAMKELEKTLQSRQSNNVSDPKVGKMYTFTSPQGHKARALCMRRLEWKVQGTKHNGLHYFQ